ncbi:appetite-regulating hormone isoform X2 [Talpa occidentalis]|uniref:appetite-regulating hormone isoform X2 n=1 Tax=Talpa occidentalis TaxID=50954 RepID=UPI00188E5F9B|nr:appetite-regulating hormone isoform X2 [Talpa occidentalis]
MAGFCPEEGRLLAAKECKQPPPTPRCEMGPLVESKHSASYIRACQPLGRTTRTPAAAMLSPATLCCLLLLSVLCADLAWGGSSFLSPEHQKVQRKESKKPPAKLQPRALEGWLRPEDGSQAEGAEDELEIRLTAPLDAGIKLSGAQSHQHGRALRKCLQDVLWEEAKDSPTE